MAVGPATTIVLNFDICQAADCKSFTINETTGIYSATNTGGWGAPNAVIGDALDARLIVTLPNLTQVTVNNLLFPTLPTTGTATISVTDANLGLSGGLPDGIYIITYQVDINQVLPFTQTSRSTTKTFLFSCNIKCCVDKLIAKIPELECTCNDQALKDALLAYGLYKSLCSAGSCGLTDKVTNILDRLNKLCNSKSCGCQ